MSDQSRNCRSKLRTYESRASALSFGLTVTSLISGHLLVPITSSFRRRIPATIYLLPAEEHPLHIILAGAFDVARQADGIKPRIGSDSQFRGIVGDAEIDNLTVHGEKDCHRAMFLKSKINRLQGEVGE